MQSDSTQYAVVGLGNPGKRYENNRHNIGADTVEQFAARIGAPPSSGWRTKHESLYCRYEERGYNLHLILPQTFMNLSGQGVQPLLSFFKLPPDRLIVVYDELELAPGTIRIRRGGSAGGHNGVSSIIERLGTPEFYRLRIGIGRPIIPSGADKGELVSGWVLSRPPAADRAVYQQGIDSACEALDCLVLEGPTAAQNRFNKKNRSEKPE